jgi:hypothetical protein
MAGRFEMSVVPRLEFCRRKDNVIYLSAPHSHGGSRTVRAVENAEESMCAPDAAPRVKAAAIPWRDSALMVGG